MEQPKYKSFDDLPLMLNAKQIQQILGLSRAGVYSLLNTQDFPTIRIGGRIIVPKDKFLCWLELRTGGERYDE